MTPFDTWYYANIEPNLPKDFPPQLAQAGKAEAAKVWNAALEHAECCVPTLLVVPREEILPAIVDRIRRARVTP